MPNDNAINIHFSFIFERFNPSLSFGVTKVVLQYLLFIYHRMVVLNDFELIQKAFKDEIFSGRPKSVLLIQIKRDGMIKILLLVF